MNKRELKNRAYSLLTAFIILFMFGAMAPLSALAVEAGPESSSISESSPEYIEGETPDENEQNSKEYAEPKEAEPKYGESTPAPETSTPSSSEDETSPQQEEPEQTQESTGLSGIDLNKETAKESAGTAEKSEPEKQILEESGVLNTQSEIMQDPNLENADVIEIHPDGTFFLDGELQTSIIDENTALNKNGDLIISLVGDSIKKLKRIQVTGSLTVAGEGGLEIFVDNELPLTAVSADSLMLDSASLTAKVLGRRKYNSVTVVKIKSSLSLINNARLNSHGETEGNGSGQAAVSAASISVDNSYIKASFLGPKTGLWITATEINVVNGGRLAGSSERYIGVSSNRINISGEGSIVMGNSDEYNGYRGSYGISIGELYVSDSGKAQGMGSFRGITAKNIAATTNGIVEGLLYSSWSGIALESYTDMTAESGALLRGEVMGEDTSSFYGSNAIMARGHIIVDGAAMEGYAYGSSSTAIELSDINQPNNNYLHLFTVKNGGVVKAVTDSKDGSIGIKVHDGDLRAEPGGHIYAEANSGISIDLYETSSGVPLNPGFGNIRMLGGTIEVNALNRSAIFLSFGSIYSESGTLSARNISESHPTIYIYRGSLETSGGEISSKGGNHSGIYISKGDIISDGGSITGINENTGWAGVYTAAGNIISNGGSVYGFSTNGYGIDSKGIIKASAESASVKGESTASIGLSAKYDIVADKGTITGKSEQSHGILSFSGDIVSDGGRINGYGSTENEAKRVGVFAYDESKHIKALNNGSIFGEAYYYGLYSVGDIVAESSGTLWGKAHNRLTENASVKSGNGVISAAEGTIVEEYLAPTETIDDKTPAKPYIEKQAGSNMADFKHYDFIADGNKDNLEKTDKGILSKANIKSGVLTAVREYNKSIENEPVLLLTGGIHKIIMPVILTAEEKIQPPASSSQAPSSSSAPPVSSSEINVPETSSSKPASSSSSKASSSSSSISASKSSSTPISQGDIGTSFPPVPASSSSAMRVPPVSITSSGSSSGTSASSESRATGTGATTSQGGNTQPPTPQNNLETEPNDAGTQQGNTGMVKIDDDTSVSTTTLGNNGPPLFGFGSVWAVTNLIMAVASFIVSVFLVVNAFIKKYRKENDSRQTEQEPKRNILLFGLTAFALGILSPIIFMLTENLNNKMVIFDAWTLLMVAITIVQLFVIILKAKIRKKQNSKVVMDEN